MVAYLAIRDRMAAAAGRGGGGAMHPAVSDRLSSPGSRDRGPSVRRPRSLGHQNVLSFLPGLWRGDDRLSACPCDTGPCRRSSRVAWDGEAGFAVAPDRHRNNRVLRPVRASRPSYFVVFGLSWLSWREWRKGCLALCDIPCFPADTPRCRVPGVPRKTLATLGNSHLHLCAAVRGNHDS